MVQRTLVLLSCTCCGLAHALVSPFSSIVQSNDQWVVHGIPTFFGLLVYGFGLGFLAATRAETL